MARRRLLSCLFLLFCLAAFAGFIALGVWQVQRLAWKEDLIARVDARVHADPVTAPAQGDWATVNKASHEYLRVQITGEYLAEGISLVMATHDLELGHRCDEVLHLQRGQLYRELAAITSGYLLPKLVRDDGQSAYKCIVGL